MNCRLPIADCRFSWRSSRPGFSFTEILFAVMILGIGFIMVAAMFPVAIQQTQATTEETNAASIGRIGVDYMRQVAAVRCSLPNGNPLVNKGVIPINTPTSILLPTLNPASLPGSFSAFTVPLPTRIPGQVWTLHESLTKDPWQVSVNGSNLIFHRDALWQAASRNIILSSDPRYAWIGMYKRDLIAQWDPLKNTMVYTPAPDAQIIIVSVQSRNTQAYDPAIDLAHPSVSLPATLEPQLTFLGGASITRNGIISTLNIPDPASGRIAEGAFVVLAQDGAGYPWTPPTPDPLGSGGVYAGRVFRVGTGSNTQWQLSPGNDLNASDPAIGYPRPQLLVIGRGATNPRNPPAGAQGFSGTAQDIAVYTGFININ